jgi:F-type H+-transporting ATPase subunit b
MLINWFTVCAQVINFLILVWLLKHFLYKPILNALDAREKGIASQLAEAKAKTAEARQEREAFQHKNEVFDQERAALMKQVTDKANAERQRLLDEVRKDADVLRARRQDALCQEQRALSTNIMRWTQKEVFAITRRTLADLAATSLEERIADVFINRLRALTPPAREQLAAALTTATQPTRVRSAFVLPPAQRQAIASALEESLAVHTPIEFETNPDLVCGIELSTNGQKVAWSIGDYLATLEKSAGDLLHVDARPDASSKAEALANGKDEAKRKPAPEPVSGPSASKANP